MMDKDRIVQGPPSDPQQPEGPFADQAIETHFIPDFFSDLHQQYIATFDISSQVSVQVGVPIGSYQQRA